MDHVPSDALQIIPCPEDQQIPADLLEQAEALAKQEGCSLERAVIRLLQITEPP